MRHRKLTAYLLTLLFAALAVVLWAMEPRTEPVPVELVLASGGDEKTLSCWQNEAGEYYLFLPGYGELPSARLRIHAREVRIGTQQAKDGMSCGEFSLDTPYDFSFRTAEGWVSTRLTFVRSANLPTLYIDTGSGSMDYIHETKGTREAGRMSLYTPQGEPAYIGSLDAVNGRGNDWLIPKKSYSLQLASGADLLEMGQSEEWILTANAFDASHLRNKLVYDFAAAAGLANSPESRWVDLYLNGEYAGLYLLCERNTLTQQRIWPEGQGKYLVSMDLQWRLEQNQREFVTTDSGYAFRIHGSEVESDQLLQLLQSAEDAIRAEDGRDPRTGSHWSELIDLDSWARKFLVEEVFGNGDGGAISQYFYGSAQEGRIYAGPVWDYDVSMGNAQGLSHGTPRSIFAARPRVRSGVRISWFYELYCQPLFRERVIRLYREEFLPLLKVFLTERLADYATGIAPAAAMNQLRWESLGAAQVSAPEETMSLYRFMEQRIEFLNQLWLEEQPFLWVLMDTDDGHGTVCFAVPPGETVPGLPEYTPGPEILGWYAVGSDTPFDPEQPILEDTELILRRVPQEPVPVEPPETQSAESRLPLKYAPFGLILGSLGLLWLLDRKQRRRNTAEKEAMPGSL